MSYQPSVLIFIIVCLEITVFDINDLIYWLHHLLDPQKESIWTIK